MIRHRRRMHGFGQKQDFFNVLTILAVASGVGLASLTSLLNNDAVRADEYIYQTVDYIQFDGASYIDTNINQTNTDMDISIDFKYATVTAASTVVFGSRGAMNGSEGLYLVNSSPGGGSELRAVFGANYSQNVLGQLDTNRHVYEFTNNKQMYLDSVLIATSTENWPTVAQPMYLGSINSEGIAGAGFVGNIYNFTIKRSGVEVLNLVPTVRYKACDPTSLEYGFVDIANGNQWYDNDGTGTLSGPMITIATCPDPGVESNVPESLNVPNTGERNE